MNNEPKKLGFGLMRLPITASGDDKTIDQKALEAMADEFIAHGFTYFDTAYVYHGGCSETAFREAVVKRYPRDAYTIADKMPVYYCNEAADYDKYFAEQLERCGVEYFDYYLLHAMSKARYESVSAQGGFEFMHRIKADGRAKQIGFSFHDTADVLDLILTEHPEMDFVQLQINYIDWENPTVQSRLCYEVARKHSKPIIIMEPIKGGALANIMPEIESHFTSYDSTASSASWAVRYCASLPGVFMVLSGMSDMDQLCDNTSYMREFKPLTPAEREIVSQVATEISASIVVPCTGCKYCVDGCPMNIAIPRYFSLLNRSNQYDLPEKHQREFDELSTKFGLPSACIVCGQCEGSCPQHLPIIESLKLVTDKFEGK